MGCFDKQISEPGPNSHVERGSLRCSGPSPKSVALMMYFPYFLPSSPSCPQGHSSVEHLQNVAGGVAILRQALFELYPGVVQQFVDRIGFHIELTGYLLS